MKYDDFEKDTAYVVASGHNGNFQEGEIFWIESAFGSVCVAGKLGGWLDKNEIDEHFFEGLLIEKSDKYTIHTQTNGSTRLLKLSRSEKNE